MQISGKRKKDVISPEDRLLLAELFQTKNELDGVRQKFEYVTEPEMVASCIYEMRSVQERYSYLLGKVRAKDISLKDRGNIVWKE
ncbi:MAG: DUF2508 family protein [Clostridiaceae bacterium]|nr:DUF2508 family protein [Clostridiaceae bacterium]